MSKSTISVTIDSEAKRILEERAKKELMDLDEMISDILRRSVLSYRGGPSTSDKVDDKFLTYFSRKKSKKRR